MEIDLGLCLIRDWRGGDEESLVRHANNPAVARNLRDIFPHPYTLDDAHAWIAHASIEDPVTDFAIVVDGDAAGGIGFAPGDVARGAVEIGFWLGEAHWGRGIATTAVRAVCHHIFVNFDVGRIYANVFERNRASIRVLEKAGFAYEGRQRNAVTKGGETLDSLMYALLLKHDTPRQ